MSGFAGGMRAVVGIRGSGWTILPWNDIVFVYLGEACVTKRQGGYTMKTGIFLSVLCAALALSSLTWSTAFAFKQEDMDKLTRTKECIFCDLRKAELPEVNLSGLRLSGTVFSEANLSRANLSGASLRNTAFFQTRLSSANLSGADLSRSNLRAAQAARANFSNAKLLGADLTKADLVEADLSGADLTRTDLTGADLTRADFRGANLSNARWTDGRRCAEESRGTCEKDESTAGQGMF